MKIRQNGFIYSQQYRQDAIKDAQVLRSRGEQVELMPLTEQNTKAVYEKYAEENHIQDITFLYVGGPEDEIFNICTWKGSSCK